MCYWLQDEDNKRESLREEETCPSPCSTAELSLAVSSWCVNFPQTYSLQHKCICLTFHSLPFPVDKTGQKGELDSMPRLPTDSSHRMDRAQQNSKFLQVRGKPSHLVVGQKEGHPASTPVLCNSLNPTVKRKGKKTTQKNSIMDPARIHSSKSCNQYHNSLWQQLVSVLEVKIDGMTLTSSGLPLHDHSNSKNQMLCSCPIS